MSSYTVRLCRVSSETRYRSLLREPRHFDSKILLFMSLTPEGVSLYRTPAMKEQVDKWELDKIVWPLESLNARCFSIRSERMPSVICGGTRRLRNFWWGHTRINTG